MKLETYLAKHYDVHVREGDDVHEGQPGERHIEIYERGEDCEPIGWFVSLPGRSTLVWVNIYGKVRNGTRYVDEAAVKAAAKAGAFYPTGA